MAELICVNCSFANDCEHCPQTMDWASWKGEMREAKRQNLQHKEAVEKRNFLESEYAAIPV